MDLNGGLLKELAHLEKHNPDPTAINVLKVKHQIKKSALETRDGPKVVVASATATVSDATAARLPFTRSMKKTLYSNSFTMASMLSMAKCISLVCTLYYPIRRKKLTSHF